MRSGYLSATFLFLSSYYGNNSFAYIKQVWKKGTCFRDKEALISSLKTIIQVEERGPS